MTLGLAVQEGLKGSIIWVSTSRMWEGELCAILFVPKMHFSHPRMRLMERMSPGACYRAKSTVDIWGLGQGKEREDNILKYWVATTKTHQ